ARRPRRAQGACRLEGVVGPVYLTKLCRLRGCPGERETWRRTPMFEELSEKLDGVLGALRQRGVLTEPMIRDGLREVRRVLLEADVNYKVAKDFLDRVQARSLGDEVIKSVTPGQQIV